jgi:cyanophycinase
MKLIILLISFLFCNGFEINKKSSYELWCIGNCNNDQNISPPTLPGTVLMGGGTDTTEAFEWQIRNANGGDFLILRASGDDAYNEWVQEIAIAAGNKLNSVTTILFNNAAASTDSIVLANIQNSEAIFFAGGDQSDYINMWSNTEVQSIIQSKVNSITIGGTSAGLAILGNYVFTAEGTSVTSVEAMENPYRKGITLGSFLKIPFLSNIITDTHFVTRDRMGRMLTFLSRVIMDSNDISNMYNTYGVGVDEHTALLLNITTGNVLITGKGTAYICSPLDHAPSICEKNTPLTFEGKFLNL